MKDFRMKNTCSSLTRIHQVSRFDSIRSNLRNHMKMITLLSLFLTTTLVAKPIVDIYDTNCGMERQYYEREFFTFSAHEQKHSHVAVLTDSCVTRVGKIRKKKYKKIVAFTIEPRAINNAPYEYIEKNIRKFDLVLTYDKYLLEKFPNKCKFVHAIGSKFLYTEGIKQKSKLCSIIFSPKTDTIGQKLRHEAFNRCKNLLEGYKGPNTPHSHCKGAWLNDYCFSIVIENSKQAHYFTEKLTECMQVGTIPIYWGCPTIDQFYDMDGIIVFNSLDELEKIVSNLSFEQYSKRLNAVKKNYELAKRYNPIYLEVIWPWIQHYF